MVLIKENSIKNRLYPQRQRKKKELECKAMSDRKKEKTRMQNKEKN